jgi:hypothetical protein
MLNVTFFLRLTSIRQLREYFLLIKSSEINSQVDQPLNDNTPIQAWGKVKINKVALVIKITFHKCYPVMNSLTGLQGQLIYC